MRFYKLRVTPNAASIASKFNEQFKPEIIQEINDPFRIDWIQETPVDQDILVGDKAGYNVFSSKERLTPTFHRPFS